MLKNKPRLLISILSVFLTLLITIPVLTEPLTAHATHYIGGEGTDSEYGVGDIGASSKNTAFYMYIVLGDGSACTPEILVYNTNGLVSEKF